jgi:hypothetical protein
LNFSYKGIYLTIQNRTHKPNVLTSFGISSGANYIEINRKLIKKKEAPYSECQINLNQSKSHLMKFFSENNLNYRLNDCIQLLTQDNINNKCNCNDIYTPALTNLSYCITWKEFDCARKNAYISAIPTEKRNFLCPIECDSAEIESKFSSSNSFSSLYIKKLRQHDTVISKYENITTITDEQIAKAVVHFNIFYTSLEYTEIAEVPVYTIVSLISNIGGTIGLFLGLSVLSSIEIIEKLLKFIMYNKKSKTSPSSRSQLS